MRAILPILAVLLPAFTTAALFMTPPAVAETHHPAAAHARPAAPAQPATANSPKSIGKFDDWQAATHQEGGQAVCYAFTRATNSSPALPGRGEVVLTVAQRPTGRDAVAISAGFPFAANADVTVSVEQTNLDFYTAQRSAFARDGHAVTAAFLKGRQAIAHAPGPRNTPVTDSFSLRGFDQAYAAINKACPAK
jgi:hypothetical protein